MSNIFLTKTV